jgi:WhiB family transcriptional regulator, redox-sensing transcriptional regulator
LRFAVRFVRTGITAPDPGSVMLRVDVRKGERCAIRGAVEVATGLAMLTGSQLRWGDSPRGVDDSRVEANMRAAMVMMAAGSADDDDQRWRQRAACHAATAELFFPVGRTGPAVEQIAAAKSVCRLCPVQLACLRFALTTNQGSGVWGGTSEEEREELRRTWLPQVRPAARSALS